MSETPGAPLSIPQMDPGAFFKAQRSETAAALMGVVDSGWYILGSEVKRFEEEFAAHFHFGAAVGVANGTDAIALALRALGVGPGDRVATVSHTAVATVAAIEIAGARPVLVEIDPDTYTISPDALARTLGAYDSIKAVIAVHLYGHPAEMQAISQIAQTHRSYVVEDCSQAHGAKLDGQYAGGMSDIATFSFYPTKNLGALGDGGVVVSNNLELTRLVRMLREYGWERRYVSEFPGVNSRLDELQAAILRLRLLHIEAGNRRRATIAAAYDHGLADTDLILPQIKPGATHVFHQYVVRHPKRNELQLRLRNRGIGTNVHYPVPVHLQPAYASRCEIDPCGLKITETIANEIVSLPMYPELSDEAVRAVIGAVHDSLLGL
jgi:dTDP-4-amino-4,6-dideoxygalactose transaminase